MLKKKNMLKNILFVFFCIAGASVLCTPLKTNAQKIPVGSYSYDAFDAVVTVNKDTTVTVEERLMYDLVGTHHIGFRSISLDKIGRITDIQITDGETNKPLVYSKFKLEANLSENFGKYTTFVENGKQTVEWYYDLSDTKHLWIIRYTLHGALEFYSKEKKDELNRTLFSNLDVSVKNVHVRVIIPQQVEKRADITGAIFSKPEDLFVDSQFTDLRTMDIVAKNVPPKGELTFTFTWPKGMVYRSGYWLDLMIQNVGMIFLIFVIWGATVFAIWRWYEFKYKKVE